MISLPIIITLGVLLLLGIIAPLFSPFSRKVEEEEVASGSDNGACKYTGRRKNDRRNNGCSYTGNK